MKNVLRIVFHRPLLEKALEKEGNRSVFISP